MRRPLVRIALWAPALIAASLSGCTRARYFSPAELNRRFLAADLELTSPLGQVRVEAGDLACLTPCTLRMTPGRYRVTARDPYGRMDFTYHVRLAAGVTELEVLPGATPP